MSRNKNRILTFLGIFLSRISGYIRDFVIAKYFGANYITDAFLNAFSIPNLLRGIFAEGNLSQAFIPLFNEHLARSKQESQELCRQVSAFLIWSTLIITILAIIFSKEITYLICYGFKNSAEDMLPLAAKYLRIMFPLLIFLSAGALCMAVLNSFDRFFITSFSSTLINLVTIIAAVFFTGMITGGADRKILSLCYGTLAGAIAYFLFLLYPYIKAGYTISLKFSFNYKPLRQTLKLMAPGIPAQALTELNFLANRFIAGFLGAGSVSYLYYANRLYQLPLALFGIGISTVLLPAAARAVNAENYEKLLDNYYDSLKFMLYFLIPISVITFYFSETFVRLVYMRSDKSFNLKTAIALQCYIAGLIFYAANIITTQLYYSKKDTKTPVYFISINMLLNFIFCIAIVKIWQNRDTRFAGLALANSISGLIYFIMLTTNIRKKIKQINIKPIIIYALKIFLIAIIAVFISILIELFFKLPDLKNKILYNFLAVTPAVIALIIFFLLSIFFRVELSLKIIYNIKVRLFKISSTQNCKNEGK